MQNNGPARPDLDALIKASIKKVENMSSEEKEKMYEAQKESWVRAEMNWPKAKFTVVNGVKVYESYKDYLND